MAGWDGNGNVTTTYDWTDDAANGVNIEAVRVEQNETDLVGAIEATLNRNGENAMAADLPMGSNKITGLAVGTDSTDGVNYTQLQNSTGQYAVAGGSSNAYTLALTPVVTAYAAGQTFKFKANHTNTGAATLNVNGLGAKNILKKNGGTVPANTIDNGAVYTVMYDGTFFYMTDEVVWGKHTISVPASGMIAALTNGPSLAQVETTTNALNYTVLDFDASTDEYAHFQIATPNSWDADDITFRVYWTTTNTGTEGVAWGIQTSALDDGDDIDIGWDTAVVVTDDNQGSAGEMLITSESGAVSIASSSAGDLIAFRIFRDVSDANDDMTEDARLVAVQIFININESTDA